MDYDAFKALGLALPLVEESTSYGTPALKVNLQNLDNNEVSYEHKLTL
ncbi:hypothetical protein GTP81_00955 [Rugamonas sp. FT107W]|uniref:Uncharacterized protein n=1 Tax=Duganella vulcania TaxID=2692166 RepID=A0A845HED8_9BURK|nr:hypothetical protein [Duganella vulcania]MYN15314.1 hypothetical protein [Duganella vulcania]